MQTIDSGFCRTSSTAGGQVSGAQGFRGFHGSLQDRADHLVRETVLSDLGARFGGGHGRHGVGIQGIAAAVSKALSAQDVTGTDAADDVLKKIETSLHKAAQALADRGVDAQTIDATIDRFRSQLANALDGMVRGASGSSGPGSGDATGGSGSSGSGASGVPSAGSGASSAGTGSGASGVTGVRKFVAREVRKERGVIDLVTAEGDRVSIRFRTKEVVAGGVTQSTAADGTSTTAAKASAFSRGGMRIEVDGDLNEDELKAIGDLLGKVDDIATKFSSGDVQAAFSAAGSLGVNSDQIAAYRLNLTYSRKITAAYAYAGASLPASTQPPASSADASTSGGSPTSSASSTASTSVSAADMTSIASYWAAGSARGASSGPSTGSATDASPGASASSATGASAGASADSATGASSSASAGSATDASIGAPTGSSTGASSATDAARGNDVSATTGDAAPGAAETTNTQPGGTPSASAQKTIVDFINDALSKLGSSNGAGRLSFSMHWKMNVLVTAIQSTQPAQPTTEADQAAAANTQLLGDSLQKIAAA